MKKVLFVMAMAGMMSFVACNNNKTAEPAVEENTVETVAEECCSQNAETIENAVEEVVDAAADAVQEAIAE